MESLLIVIRGAILGLNVAFGAAYALIGLCSMVIGPIVVIIWAVSGNAVAASAGVAAILFMPAAGIVWFITSDRAKSNERLVFLLPIFWALTVGVIAVYPGT